MLSILLSYILSKESTSQRGAFFLLLLEKTSSRKGDKNHFEKVTTLAKKVSTPLKA